MNKSTKFYSISQFRKDYPDENTCLDRVFTLVHGNKPCPKCKKPVKFRRIATRKCYQCPECYHQIYPCAGTPFEKSTTPLMLWFYAAYLFTTSKNGLSACELQRQIGVTYKTAWRMVMKIRSLIKEDNSIFEGVIELDESYIGGKNKNRHKDKRVKHSQGRSYKDKMPVFGIMQRKGKVTAYTVPNVTSLTLMPIIISKVKMGSSIMTDEWKSYSRLTSFNYNHKIVYHSRGEYVKDDCYTNGLENFWSVVKRTINGSYIHVSKKYLQFYIDEVTFRYNNRGNKDVFHVLLNFLSFS